MPKASYPETGCLAIHVFLRSCELVLRHLSLLSTVPIQRTQVTKNTKNTQIPPFIEDVSDGDLASENASDFPEVIERCQERRTNFITVSFYYYFTPSSGS